jgi:hypothetical protein
LTSDTEKLRASRKAARGEPQKFDFGYTPAVRRAAE